MKRRIIACLLCLALCLPLVPAVWAEPAQVNVEVIANINGAEIYLNGEFTHKVTPATLTASVDDTVSLSLPGYTAAAQAVSGAGALAFTLAPELYPAAYAGHSQTISVTDCEELNTALAAARDQGEDAWTVIDLTGYTNDGWATDALFRDAYHYTLYGGESGVAFCQDINLYGTDGVRLVNLRFPTGRRIHFRVPGGDQMEDSPLTPGHSAVNTSEIYILGCTFAHEDYDADALGIGQCVPYGCGGTEYGGTNTVNWYGIHFSNNDITGQLFNFAAAGDGDYNTVRDYTVCANRFTKGGIGFLCADAHSWYVYEGSGKKWSGDWEAGEFAFCDHNRMEDIRISGNAIRNGTIGLLSANLGNQYNVIRRVTICNNTVTNDAVSFLNENSDQGDMWAGALSLRTAVVADNYGKEMEYYPPYMKPDFSHTDGNVLEDVTVEDNVFQSGYCRGVDISCLETNVGEQCGKDNIIRNITVQNNAFTTGCGVNIGCYGSYTCNTKSSTCENNVLEDVHFCGNTVTRLDNRQVNADFGILVAGEYVGRYGEYRSDPDSYPPYSGATRRVEVGGNTVTNYTYGIMVAGSAGDYAQNMTVSDVTVTGNTVVNKNFYTWPLTDIGIVAAGSALQTGIGDYTPLCNQNCAVENITIADNRVTAMVGVLAAGLAATRRLDFDSHGNTARNICITGNTLTQRPIETVKDDKGNDHDNGNPLCAIVTADIFSEGYSWQQERDDYIAAIVDVPDALAGNRLEQVTVSGNTCTGFPVERIHVSGAQDFSQLEAVSAATAELYSLQNGDNYFYTIRVRFGYGDLNEDGTLTVLDMQCLFEYLSQDKLPPAATAELADAFRTGTDVNGDSVTNILDYQALYELLKIQ